MKISMDGKGWYTDNIFGERLWRTVKCEEVYLKAYASASEARRELGAYYRFHNDQRPHQALGYRTPAEMFHQAINVQINVQEEDWRQMRSPPESALVSSERSAGLSLNWASTLSN